MNGFLQTRRRLRAAETRNLASALQARGWRLADSALARLVGWMGRRAAPQAGLCLMPCRAIHTFFMRFPIDVVFFARDGTVLRRIDRLEPGRAVACRTAFAVLELPAGAAASHALVEGGNVKWPAGHASDPFRPPPQQL